MPVPGRNKGKSKPKNNEPLIEGDFVIPVMGATGAGKSTFINMLVGEGHMRVGHDMDSCTSEPTSVVIDPSVVKDPSKIKNGALLGNRRLVLLDTPGFDDTFQPDSVILKKIADWLKNAYDQKAVVGGVIYLHDITHDRFVGSARQNLEMFRHLCGANSLGQVVIGTTKWEKLVDSKEGGKREAFMKGKHWKDMIHKGTMVERLSRDSPFKLVDRVLGGFEERLVLQIQKEVAVEKKIIPETAAGKALRYTIQQVLEQQKDLVRWSEKAEQGDADAKAELEAAKQKIDRLTKELNGLKVPFTRRFLSLLGIK